MKVQTEKETHPQMKVVTTNVMCRRERFCRGGEWMLVKVRAVLLKTNKVMKIRPARQQIMALLGGNFFITHMHAEKDGY